MPAGATRSSRSRQILKAIDGRLSHRADSQAPRPMRLYHLQAANERRACSAPLQNSVRGSGPFRVRSFVCTSTALVNFHDRAALFQRHVPPHGERTCVDSFALLDTLSRKRTAGPL